MPTLVSSGWHWPILKSITTSSLTNIISINYSSIGFYKTLNETKANGCHLIEWLTSILYSHVIRISGHINKESIYSSEKYKYSRIIAYLRMLLLIWIKPLSAKHFCAIYGKHWKWSELGYLEDKVWQPRWQLISYLQVMMLPQVLQQKSSVWNYGRTLPNFWPFLAVVWALLTFCQGI